MNADVMFDANAVAERVIAAANHQPEISYLAMIVAVLERIQQAVGQLKTTNARAEHVAAHAHIRSALQFERRMLAEYEQRNALVGKAIGQGVAEK